MTIKRQGPAGWAVHPGEILREEFLEPLGVTPHKLAVALRVSPPTINDIVLERRGVTPETAARLAKYFGTSEQFWLNLQNTYSLFQAKKEIAADLRAIKPLGASAGA
jgi:antitoxin HigA-1